MRKNQDTSGRQGQGTLISRRGALKAGSTVAGAAVAGGAALWYSSQPVAAAQVANPGASNVEFGTDQNVITVTSVDIQPEIDVAFSNFSSGVTQAEIQVSVQTDAEQQDDQAYEGTADTAWGAPTGSSGTITFSDTIPTDGTSSTFTTPAGDVSVDGPDFTAQTSSTIGADPNITFNDPIPIDTVLEEDANIDAGTGIDMFPQDIDPGYYGLSIVSVDYAVTLTGAKGDSNQDASPSHSFNVAVENAEGTTDDSEVDSKTSGSGTDGT